MTGHAELREQTLAAVSQSEEPYIQDRIKLGVAILAVFVGVMAMWSIFAPLSTGAVVSGQVEVDGQTLNLQHLEGGIVEQVYVRNGDSVKEGDIIVAFSDIAALADRKYAAAQMLALDVRRDRLLSEKNKSKELLFSTYDYPMIPDQVRVETLALEKDYFLSRQNIFNKENTALLEQIESTTRIVANGKEQLARVEEQLSLIIKEVIDTSGLYEKGYATQSRVLALKRQREAYEGDKYRLLSQISDAGIQVENARVNHKKYNATFYDDVGVQLQELNVTSQQVAGLLAIANDKLERTKVRVPRDGIVMNMQVHKPGEVVATGATIASMVPENTRLIISAKLNPGDSASITEGLDARITILAFNSRTAPTLEGRVIYVSPDVVQDEQTGLFFYPVHVELLDSAFAALGNEAIQPGMPAQVVITTAERPIIGYLLDPIMQTVRNAFHEK